MTCNTLLKLFIISWGLATVTGCNSPLFLHYWEKPELPEHQRTLKDKLLVIQVRSIQDQLLIIENNKDKNTENQSLISLKKSLNRQLIQKEQQLLDCSLYHNNKRLTLALNCATLAHSISQSNNSSDALNTIKKMLADKARERQVTQTANTKRKRDILMALAKKQLLQTNHSATIKTLNQLLVIAPNDKEAKQLLKELKVIQEKHVTELIAMGDKLYRDERIEQALAVWKAAKNLTLDNKEVLIRIDRAEKVLGSVNKIKSLPDNKTQI